MEEVVMQVLHISCAGLDVHKDVIVACRRVARGKNTSKEVESFGSTTRELLRLSAWLEETGTTHVVMESTGVFWKPVWNILGDQFELILANPRHVKNVPGRKTDVKDAEWLADLLAHGLVEASFVPDAPIAGLRDLTRTAKQLTRERVQHVQRIQKHLQAANVRLDSVLSDIMGKSGRRIIDAIVGGQTEPRKLAALARGVKATPEQLAEALEGRVSLATRKLIRTHLSIIDALDRTLAELEKDIDEALLPFAEAVALLKTIPGLGDGTARVVVAEVGADMSRFKTPGHLVSWAGLCPRMDESAGKRRSTKIRDGNKWLKSALCQAAWAGVRCKKRGYLHAQFWRLRARRGPGKAIIAVAASILTAVHAILSTRCRFRDLGNNFFERKDQTHTVAKLTKRLASLGYEVELRPAA
jgi:transposase